MKSFREYLNESEETFDRPTVGDNFAINIREETLLETYIVDEIEDGIVLHADEKTMTFLESYGYLGEALSESQDFEIDSDEDGDDIEVTDQGEYDQEGDMAKDDLATIVRAAKRLTGMLDDNENMPEWVQSKINKAADYVDTAADYIESNKTQGVAEGSKQTWAVTGTWTHRKYMRDPQTTTTKVIANSPEEAMRKYKSHMWNEYERKVIDMKVKPYTNQAITGPSQGVAEGFNEQYIYLSPLRGLSEPKFVAKVKGRVTNAILNKLAAKYKVSIEDFEWGDAKWAQQHQDVAEGEMDEAKYQGREVPLGKPMAGDVAKSKVYVRDPKTGNVKKVNFGDPNMRIKKSDPDRRRSFRARHNCDNPGSRLKARYWSCRAW